MKRRLFLKNLGAAGAAVVLGEAAGSQAQAAAGRIDPQRLAARNANRSTVTARNGMVCASQPLAVQAGLDILKAGGNAIDAAVATNAMLGLTEPMSNGIGGDLFAIVWHESDGKLQGLNASGRAPYAWSIAKAGELGIDAIPTYSPLAWTVPGCVSGWQMLLQQYGSLPLSRLLQAPIRYAQEGFVVAPVAARYWAARNYDRFPTLKQTFAPEGRPPRYGEVFRNPDLAKTLTLLANEGADAFYQGEIAERIVKFSTEQGGYFNMKDFADHRANWVDPVSTSYRSYDIWEIPPNGQGIATLQILNLLEHFDIPSLQPNSAEHLHLFLEAKKLAFEDRAVYYADMEFADVPLKELISKEYAAERVRQIDRRKAAISVAAGRLPGQSDTVYLTTADRWGNMVSLIQSTFHGFGSQYVPDNLGFALQNRGQQFSLNPRALNSLRPHKRPFHTIIPSFVTRKDRPVFSFGVMGGDFQPQGQSQVLMNLLDFGMSVQQAGEQPRVRHHESSTPTGAKMVQGGYVTLEKRIPDATRRQLKEMGHDVRDATGAHGGYQGIWREDDPMRYFGGSEPRQDGCALGY